MHYLFVFLVALNAGYLGYQLLKEKDASILQPIANVPQKNFPITLRLVPQHTLMEQISDISIKTPVIFSKKVVSTT